MEPSDRNTLPRKRVSPESFLRVMPTPFAATGADGKVEYKKVPEEISDRDKALLPAKPWRITLTSAQKSEHVIALELQGDVVFGSSTKPDAELSVNLADMEGEQPSVSQRHLKMRPGKDKIFLMDLGSKNGTYVNGTPASASSAIAVQDGDLITLGRLHLRLKVIR